MGDQRKFSQRSLDKLETCHKDLQRIFHVVLQIQDCVIIQGHRLKDEQDEYFRTGKSKLEWPNSKHNDFPSRAIDVAPYPIDWDDIDRFWHFSGIVRAIAHQLGVHLQWGGNWSFQDMVHYELID